MPPSDLNVVLVIRDYALLQGLSFLPLLAFAVASRRRRWLFPLGLTCGVISWWIAVGLLLHRLGGLTDTWRGPDPSHVASFLAADAAIGLTVWYFALAVFGVLYVLGRFLARGGRTAFRTPATIAAVVVYTLAATWGAHAATMGDTFVAPGYTRGGWARIAPGMSRVDVEGILGAPIPEARKSAFASDQGAECWIGHSHSGYYACVWFRDDTVRTRIFWYDE